MRRAHALAIAGLSLGLIAADAIDTRAAELAALRREVETRATEIQLAKEELRGRLKAIDAQKMEIEVQIRREELRLAQIEGEGASRRAELADHASAHQSLGPAVRGAISEVRGQVERGLPFRTPERLAELDELSRQLEAGTLTAESATARLWAFVEDELRLTRESTLDRQIIPLADGEVLAEVARLGMVALYFRADGGQTGAAVRDGEGWRWVVFTSRDEAKAVETLMDKLRHGVRSGGFSLPNPAAPRSP